MNPLRRIAARRGAPGSAGTGCWGARLHRGSARSPRRSHEVRSSARQRDRSREHHRVALPDGEPRTISPNDDPALAIMYTQIADGNPNYHRPTCLRGPLFRSRRGAGCQEQDRDKRPRIVPPRSTGPTSAPEGPAPSLTGAVRIAYTTNDSRPSCRFPFPCTFARIGSRSCEAWNLRGKRSMRYSASSIRRAARCGPA